METCELDDELAQGWTAAMCDAACAEGWCIFESDTRGLEIERVDADMVFASDDDAIAHVKMRASEGAPHAILALKIHERGIRERGDDGNT